MSLSDAPPYEHWHRHSGITLYGRKPALEALSDASLSIHCLHLADSNRDSSIITQLIALATDRQIAIRYHDRMALSRISKNARQDQGVAVDVLCPRFASLSTLLDQLSRRRHTLLALDGITNPQNVGMIIRSAAAAGIDGILYPQKGVASLGPLVIKASAGTVFRAPLILCEALTPALQALSDADSAIVTLDARSNTSLYDLETKKTTVFVLGGETNGVSAAAKALAQHTVSIPMANGVESLNVAVAAALVAFHLGRVG